MNSATLSLINILNPPPTAPTIAELGPTQPQLVSTFIANNSLFHIGDDEKEEEREEKGKRSSRRKRGYEREGGGRWG